MKVIQDQRQILVTCSATSSCFSVTHSLFVMQKWYLSPLSCLTNYLLFLVIVATKTAHKSAHIARNSERKRLKYSVAYFSISVSVFSYNFP